MKVKNISSKKQILYVDQDSLPLARFLKEKYCLATYRNLDSGVVELIRQSLSFKKFDAIITHLPHRPINNVRYFPIESVLIADTYGKSLEILRRIKMIMDLPIIAYTGAGEAPAIYSVFMEEGGIDHIVHKSMELHRDAQEIHNALENLFQKYEKIAQHTSPPQLYTENGYTAVEVRINLNGGAGLSSATKISQECQRYPEEVWFRKSNSEDNNSYNGKELLDLLAMCPKEGQMITIQVKGEGEKAERLLRRLYSAFSSRYSFTIDFDRFKE
jgi:phosphotransferase system HPr-like phosphotransfer protein